MKNVDTSLGEAPSIAERLRWGGSHGTALYFLLTVSTFPRHRYIILGYAIVPFYHFCTPIIFSSMGILVVNDSDKESCRIENQQYFSITFCMASQFRSISAVNLNWVRARLRFWVS